MVNKVKLYTYHSADFDLVEDTTDLTKVDDFLIDAYKWLYKILDTKKVIWCWGEKENHNPWHSTDEIEWVLEVPRDEIISVVNGSVWDCIIGDFPNTPSHCLWWYDLPEEEFEQKMKEWTRHNPFRGWDKLFDFQSDDEVKYAQYLIPSPIKKEWVMEKNRWSGWEKDTFHFSPCRRGYKNKIDAQNFVNSMKSFVGDLLEFHSMTIDDTGHWHVYGEWDVNKLLKKKGLKVDR